MEVKESKTDEGRGKGRSEEREGKKGEKKEKYGKIKERK